MNVNARSSAYLRAGSWLALLALLWLTGCATRPRIDWNSRIGTYTYDQAVLELGPPDRVASLTDETKVAEWLVSRGHTHAFSDFDGPFYHPYYYYPGPIIRHYSTTTTPDAYLRLTFSPDGKLQSWGRYYR